LNASHDDTSGYNQDTIRIHHDTCILDASSEPRWIHTRYARDTQQIHQDTYLGSKDGNHYRILEHTTGYIYQQGFPPSATEEPDEEDPEVDDKTGGDDGDQGEDRETKKKRKNKKSPHPRSRREARVLRHLTRQERQRKGRPRRRPSASKRGRNK
jgi:hypothetical protein